MHQDVVAALHLNVLVHVQCHKIGQLSRDFAVKQVSDKFIIFVSALGYTVVWDAQGNVKITVSKCDVIVRFSKTFGRQSSKVFYLNEIFTLFWKKLPVNLFLLGMNFVNDIDIICVPI